MAKTDAPLQELFDALREFALTLETMIETLAVLRGVLIGAAATVEPNAVEHTIGQHWH
jgi:hypothetical protein